MKTAILDVNQINEAVDLIKNGQIVAIPTETVYGLAGDAQNDDAVKKIFAAKNRPSDHPLIIHIDSFEKLEHWVEEIPQNAKKLADQFWPGPLTMIFKKKKNLNILATCGLPTIGIRIPNHPLTLEIIKKLNKGLAAPSANAHKRTSPTNPNHVLKTLSGKISAILDGGKCEVGLESTIVDVTKEVPVILRPGSISAKMLQDTLGFEVLLKTNHQEKVAGNMAAHYQPQKPLFLVSREEINQIEQSENIAIMHYSALKNSPKFTYYKMPQDHLQYAKILYETLYQIDSTDVDKIFVEKPPASDSWIYINDRLQKAAAK